MATHPLIYKYSLDLTGESPVNFVRREKQDLPSGTIRAVVPNYGAFYLDDLEVRDANSGAVLEPEVQYYAVQRSDYASDVTGKEVCTIIVVTDPDVFGRIEYDYRVIGGEFTSSVFGYREMLSKVDWGTVTLLTGAHLGEPPPFPPAPHLHDAGDLFGFTYVVMALENLKFAILIGHEVDHEELKNRITAIDEAIDQAVLDHVNDTSNSHQVTKMQVGLGKVQNYPMATRSQAEGGSHHSSYMSPLRTEEAIDHQFGTRLRQHRSDKGDPHRVTKSQVGLSRADNTSDVNKPVHYAFASYLGSHTGSRRNPHNVTAEQLNAYDKQGINTLLNSRLPVNGTAVDANRLQGRTAYSIERQIHDDMISRANGLFAYKNHSHSQYSLKGHSLKRR